jgi:hypothetical protein
MMFNPFKKRKTAGQVKALFLHIQKTAGTSVIHLARQYYGSNLTSHGDCWNGRPQDFQDVGFVSGHIGYQFAKPLMHDRFSFTFLRDPVERILSMYYFCRDRNPDEFEIYRKANELDLTSFLEAALWDPCIRKNVWNNQVWQLAHGYAHQDNRTIGDFEASELLGLAKQHLLEFSFVGFTETFDTDASTILKHLSIPEPSRIPRLNDLPARPHSEELSPAVLNLLAELTVMDNQLYLFAEAIRRDPGRREGTPE